jgi:hypothetical protein
MSEQKHWKKVYKTKSDHNVSWFQEHAARSLEIVRSIGPNSRAAQAV